MDIKYKSWPNKICDLEMDIGILKRYSDILGEMDIRILKRYSDTLGLSMG